VLPTVKVRVYGYLMDGVSIVYSPADDAGSYFFTLSTTVALLGLVDSSPQRPVGLEAFESGPGASRLFHRIKHP
jgi:hypothetical protein